MFQPVKIAPSILSADFMNLQADIEMIEEGGAGYVHVDVMDGHFVPNLSYGPALVKALKKRYPEAVLDVHLMVEPGEDFLDMFLAAKPASLEPGIIKRRLITEIQPQVILFLIPATL